ncbi:DinB family protein [Helicobacter cappadocius]|uniref:DinB family protein n=1 Tax=Helicobacter cappadocius TaxID=3063998 RepID=A0AA90PKP9_9HELI|nr:MULTISPECIES: DinB family protein [unclassified Helicobacter]MDO7252826.1 DinB family protein [Helicobacter sp. faydin-H75]MDP2538869.1 DinB family protein [Helicobacter sp. faydin-H76]
MKEIMKLEMKYNKVSNEKMMECLKKCGKEIFEKDMGLYFKSIAGLFEHTLTLGAHICGRYSSKELDGSAIVSIIDSNMQLKPEYKTMEKMFEYRTKIDDFMIALIEKESDFTQIETLEFPGITFQKPTYQILLSVLTHDIHHRGQISAALDILKIENDFNGMLAI